MKIRTIAIIAAAALILIFAEAAAAKDGSLSLSVCTDDGKMIKGQDAKVDLLLGKATEATSGAFSVTTKQGITVKEAVWNIENVSFKPFDSDTNCGAFLNEIVNGTAARKPISGNVLTLTVSISENLSGTVNNAIELEFTLGDSTLPNEEETVFCETVSLSVEIMNSPHNTVLKDAADGKWYYYSNGARDMSFTGFAENVNGRWRVENGTVDFDYSDVAKDKGEWRYYKDGKWQKTAETVAKNSNGWWYIKSGVVQFDVTSVVKRADNATWWYVRGGKVQFDVTSVVKRADNGTWWYVKGGKVQFDVTSVVKRADNGTWWYVKNGQVRFDETGIVKRVDNGTRWYVKKGQVQFDYSGTVKYNGKTYTIKKGKVV
ncbi:MAG: hypothetical protein IKR26_02325 [Lachnospiraceae bacterium]|nr:hypothetical protein [Lachnospiraceae bacterium]